MPKERAALLLARFLYNLTVEHAFARTTTTS